MTKIGNVGFEFKLKDPFPSCQSFVFQRMYRTGEIWCNIGHDVEDGDMTCSCKYETDKSDLQTLYS